MFLCDQERYWGKLGGDLAISTFAEKGSIFNENGNCKFKDKYNSAFAIFSLAA
jgi:hypothetical protein